MDIRKWAARIPHEFYTWGGVNAAPWNLHDYRPIVDPASPTFVQGMSTPSNMHLINVGVQCMGPSECYLEVGAWRGRTLIGALLGNDAFGIAIDDDSMNEHDEDKRSSQDVWHENVARFGMTERTEYVNGSVPAVWATLGLRTPVGVYLFDGDKSTAAAAYDGLAGVVPFLADEALIIVDDANEITIRMAVDKFERAHPTQAFKIIDIPTPGNCWPMFWNGVLALAWRRQA